MTSKAKRRILAAARIILAPVLLVLVFKWGHIPLYDSIQLRDGTVLTGAITKLPSADVTIVSKGKKLKFPLESIVHNDGDYEITDNSVTVKDGKGTRTVTGGLVKKPDLTVSIESTGASATYTLKQVAYDANGAPQIAQIGFVPVLKRATAGGYVKALLLLGIVPLVAAVRWRMLLEAQGVRIGVAKSAKLTLTGLFFNNFMPGLTGGDVVKAYYVAKLTTDRKTHAVVTVLLDRIIGMVALAIVAGVATCAGYLVMSPPEGGEWRLAVYCVVLFLAASVCGVLFFYSRRLRSLGRMLLKAIPGVNDIAKWGTVHKAIEIIRKVDSAILLYRSKKMVLVKTTLISFVAHTAAILSFYFFAESLGVQQIAVVSYFIVVPISFIVSSISPTPAGLGWGEWAFKIFFPVVGVPAAAAVAMSIIYRFTQALWTLPGGVIWLLQRDKATAEQVEAEVDAELTGDDGDAGS